LLLSRPIDFELHDFVGPPAPAVAAGPLLSTPQAAAAPREPSASGEEAPPSGQLPRH
jgi:hypothetical protein